MRTLLAGMVFSLIASSSAAQWIQLPMPGIPRTSDGKPDLPAPAPRTRDGKPDLSGMWAREGDDRYYNNAAADLKPADVKPWAQALYQSRLPDFGKDSMEVQCLPLGPAAVTTSFFDFKFIQTPSVIVILIEDLTYRQIHLDGRPLPKDPNPSWRTREGVGLLGSAPFEIPRSVERDNRYDHLRTGEALRRGLAAKNRFNLGTIGIFLFTRWVGIFLIKVIDVAAFEFFYDVFAHTIMAALFALSVVVAAVYYALMEGYLERISPPPPAICSIYDSRFWWVERVWKLHPMHFLHFFNGTPFRNVLWRLIGVRIGRRVFDDGVYISEPTLTTVGDECVFNHASMIQCDSQEDGTYKSGRTTLGAGCTLGVNAFVHYGVTMADGSVLAADSFLMKGEEVPRHARWGGNPARAMR